MSFSFSVMIKRQVTLHETQNYFESTSLQIVVQIFNYSYMYVNNNIT